MAALIDTNVPACITGNDLDRGLLRRKRSFGLLTAGQHLFNFSSGMTNPADLAITSGKRNKVEPGLPAQHTRSLRFAGAARAVVQ